jgi:undecaprenyl-diphosphatase
MSGMEALRPLFDWLADHTYLVVFVGTLIDATGLPFPGRLLLAAAGALAATGQASVLGVIAVAALGAALVDHAWYLTITRGASRLIDLYCRLRGRPRGCSAADADYFRRYGAATIVLGRFFTVVRVMAWPVAARHGVGWGTFTVLDVLGATLWASIWALLGWLVGAQWESAARSAGGWAAGGGVLVLFALAAPLALRVWRRRQLSRAPRESAVAASRGWPAGPRARPRP